MSRRWGAAGLFGRAARLAPAKRFQRFRRQNLSLFSAPPAVRPGAKDLKDRRKEMRPKHKEMKIQHKEMKI